MIEKHRTTTAQNLILFILKKNQNKFDWLIDWKMKKYSTKFNLIYFEKKSK